ncbi:MAG: GH116 family glycosyl-hydrolase [Planctomycetota bacterium]|nr:GH116 family glycosyl-hydrolase [Planctomycetota bacterium]
MSKDCCCGGRCAETPVVELSRREFLERMAVASTALALAGDGAWAKTVEASGPAPVAPLQGQARKYPLTAPRVYRGKNLEAVAMPIGGIGTGSIWLDGQGRLAVWQIFNNLSEIRIPDSCFAVQARSGDKPAVMRVLQTTAEGPLAPVPSLEYEGGYPIARLSFQDPELPVQVLLEAFNPLIPTDAANSSIPCAIFRLTARNTSQAPAEVSLLATLQNAVGSQGAGGIKGVRFGGYGGNRNRVVHEKNFTAVAMDKSPDPVATGPVKVRGKHGAEVEGAELFWLAGVADLSPQVAETLARIASEGGTVLADGVQPGFWKTIATLRDRQGDTADVATVFEDFERDNYDGWKIEGEAFGTKPSRGAEAGQQPVSGFAGRRLVNTFVAGDGPQGKATSKPFQIERRYIGFLIGGGNHPGQTCINLRIENRMVRSAVGKNLESLEPVAWDVSELKGQQAVIEILDLQSGGWGHINIDQIIFADVPPEALLRQGTASDVAAKAVQVPFTGAETATSSKDKKLVVTGTNLSALPATASWNITQFTRLAGFRPGEKGYRTLATTEDGAPLIIEGPLGKGRVILCLAPNLPWDWGRALLASCGGRTLTADEQLVPGAAGWGTMALVALEPKAVASNWATGDELAAFLSDVSKGQAAESVSKSGETVNGALGVPFTLPPGEQKTVTFAIIWHFPNVQRFQHSGNLYSRHWLDALAVGRYVAEHAQALWDRTRLCHETIYQSNLPEEFLDAMTSQIAILRGPTCFWSEDGYFGGFEGSYGCCPLNCTHVWNYAQSHARLFPEVGHNMRISDFVTFLHESGETSHRQHSRHTAFIDGHCACIEAAYR